MSITLIHPAPDAGWAGQRLDGVLKCALAGREVRTVRRAQELSGLEGQRLPHFLVKAVFIPAS